MPLMMEQHALECQKAAESKWVHSDFFFFTIGSSFNMFLFIILGHGYFLGGI